MPRDSSDLGDKAVTLLATLFVLLGGAISCIFMIVTSSPAPHQTLLAFGGGCAGAAFLFWLLRERDPLQPKAAAWSWLKGRRRRKKVGYALTPRSLATGPTTPRQPPSADQIRELKQEAEQNTWVPNQTRRS